MSFLFGWTKYFRSNETEHSMEPSDDELDVIDTNTNENMDNMQDANAGNEPPYTDDDEEEEDSLLGGEFETLEDEIEFLREQNNKLKAKCKFHQSQHHLLRSNLQKTGVMQMKINGQLMNVRQPQTNLTLDELSEKVEARLPQFLRKAADSTVYIPSNVQNEVGIVDIEAVDWGEMLKYDTLNTNDALSTFNNNDINLEYEQTQTLGGPFIVLRESDIIDAIACFVAQCVMNIPECHNLDHEEMLLMISGTFSELKKKGPLGKMYDWGTFVYQSYGWTATAYTVYTNAAMARTVLSCMVSAAWLIGVL
eukprot:467931_1